jgi:hypothetical protein
MQLVVLPVHHLPIALRVFHEVLTLDGPLSARGREFLVALVRAHHTGDVDAKVDIDVDHLDPITPATVAAGVAERAQRTWIVQFAVVAAMVDGTMTPAKYEALRVLDQALGVAEPIIKVLGHLSRGHERRARLAMAARLFPPIWASAYRKGGVRGVIQALGSFTRGYDDADVAWRFRQLGLLPEGTVGYALWKHYTAHQRLFPGEKGSAITERMIFHDYGHILSGYDTDNAGEIRQGAFQAGYVRGDGFALLMFTLLQWHMGLRLTPVTPGVRGFFAPAEVLHALQRGAACKFDLFDDAWIHWDVVELSVEEFRDQYGIPPLVPDALSASGFGIQEAKTR